PRQARAPAPRHRPAEGGRVPDPPPLRENPARRAGEGLRAPPHPHRASDPGPRRQSDRRPPGRAGAGAFGNGNMIAPALVAMALAADAGAVPMKVAVLTLQAGIGVDPKVCDVVTDELVAIPTKRHRHN